MRTILIADDEPAVRGIIRRLLENDGYQILEAGDGIAALEMMANTPIDLLITDLAMPDGDGLELIQNLRRWPSPPKILVVSGFDAYLPAGVKDCGVDAMLPKPFRPAELVECVRQLLLTA